MSPLHKSSVAIAVALLLPLAGPAQAADGACEKWDISGHWVVRQSNGATVHMDLQQEGVRLHGVAEYSTYNTEAQKVQTIGGPVNGTLENGNLMRLTTYWSNSTAGVYTGSIGSHGALAGFAVDKNDPSNRATFTASGRPKCKPWGTPELPPPPMQEAPPPAPPTPPQPPAGEFDERGRDHADNDAPGDVFNERGRAPTGEDAPADVFDAPGRDRADDVAALPRGQGEVAPGQFDVGRDELGDASFRVGGWAHFARLAAGLCDKRGFAGGHFNGHHKDGQFRLFCHGTGASWRDALAGEIAATQWSFADVNSVGWAQASRAAERLCAQAGGGFAGGQFNGHMLDGRYGLTCHAGPAQWFDATGAELAATGFGFATPKLDDVPWDQAMRAATGFCIGKGFAGGFMNGHQAPDRYGVVCRR